MTTISTVAGRKPTLAARGVDRLFSRALKLPPAMNDYSVRRDIPVPMRDGVVLLADHYVPAGPARGTVLVRSPYGRAALFALFFARPFAERGFHIVIQSTRGTFGSGGQVGAFAGEVEDGADTVAWLRDEPWFTGTFATLGVSYLGLTQWALLVDPPAELRAAIITSGPHDTGRLLRGNGALSLTSAVAWTDLILHQDRSGPVRATLDQLLRGEKRRKPVLDGVPLGDAVHATYGDEAPWLHDWMAQADPTSSFWDGSRVTEALSRVSVPVLLHTGWHDLISPQVFESYEVLRDRGAEVSLVVGPWSHADLMGKGAGTVTRDSLAWLAAHLADDGAWEGSTPVRAFVGGRDEWLELADWPPATTHRRFHLQPGGGLAVEEAPAASPVTFTYDPADPTPTVGGMTNAKDGGRQDNQQLEARPDVLTFTSAPLGRDLEVMGSPVIDLQHGSDNQHADVFVRLCEVDDKGRSWNLSEQFTRLSTASESDLLHLELSPIAHRFRAGTSIRVQISGGSHPAHDRNLGTGEPMSTGTRMRPSHRTIAFGPSVIVLPVTA